MQDSVAQHHWGAWFRGKNFSVDWCSHHFPLWAEILLHLKKQRCNVLEIGSWEGRSAIFFLEFLPRCRITCVDTFAGSDEHKPGTVWNQNVAGIENRFDANLASYTGRVEKIKTRSVDALGRLALAGRMFEVIYIDGSHAAADVLSDSTLAWPMLRADGILIWDDYEWGYADDDRPQSAIDAFLRLKSGELTEIHRGYQVAVRKNP